MELPRLQNGLLANYTFSLYFPDGAISIIDKPMSAQQLHGIIAAVFNSDMVPKNELAILWIGVLRQVLGFYRDRDSVSCQYFHERKLWVLCRNFKAKIWA